MNRQIPFADLKSQYNAYKEARKKQEKIKDEVIDGQMSIFDYIE